MKAPLLDCIVVLDTLGTRSNAAILGIVALRFDLDDATNRIETLDLAISADSNRDAGRTYDGATLAWWAERPDQYDVFTRESMSLSAALRELSDFYGDAMNLWTSKGFETHVLASAYEHFKLDLPWPYWAACCARTTASLAAWLDAEQNSPSVYGVNALETAKLRLNELRIAYTSLKKKASNNGIQSACG